jgi:predicted ester cyclase
MRKTTYQLPNSSSLRTMPTTLMACSLSAQMARSDDMLRTAARASCQSVVASTVFGAFPNAVPNFRVKVIELIPAEGNTVVIQAEMSGPMPVEVPGIAKKGQDVHIPHCYILRFDTDSKITRLDAYWDNTVLNSIKVSGV